MATDGREPPPEAQMIRRYREALGISPEVAADRLEIKMSARRWRQIEAGEETKGGRHADASPGQLAHMARAVGVRPEQLDELGKQEAAEILRVIEARAASTPEEEPADPLAGLPEDTAERRAALEARLDARARETLAIAEELRRLTEKRETG
jgi:transcriptional regulator with XRE-family HTH domain